MINVKLVSIISPVYRAEKILDELCKEIIKVFEDLQINFEIILVDDSSPDRSWEKIVELAKQDPRIRGFQLSRNYGQHYAITAGIDQARGDVVGVLDCDLEDHPKHFAKLLEKMKEGHNIVFARRQDKKHSFFRRTFSRAFVVLFNFLTGLEHDSAVGTFSLIDRKVANAFKQHRESLRSYTALLLNLGFSRGYVDVPHGSRFEGKSTYTLGKLVSVLVHSTISYTEKPLQAISLLGLVMALFSFAFSLYVLASYFFLGGRMIGWSSLIASIYLTSGLILLSMGIVALYLGKCLRETLNCPLYHIKETTSASSNGLCESDQDIRFVAKSNFSNLSNYSL